MVFFNVCDTLSMHPKALVAGNSALGLWVRAGSWCQQVLSDGAVPAEVARGFGSKADADRLVRAGLWVATGREGYVFHEFLGTGRNRSKEQVLKERAEAAERQRKQREKRDAEKANEEASRRDFELINGELPWESHR